MKTRILVFCFLLTTFFTQQLFAQGGTKFTIAYFIENILDTTASDTLHALKDSKGENYAIIKVKSGNALDNVTAYKFDFGQYAHEIDTVESDLWVYVQAGADKVTIARDGYRTIKDFNLRTTIASGRTYEMTLLSSSAYDPAGGELMFKVAPSNAKVLVLYKPEGSEEDYREFGVTSYGIVTKNVAPGAYVYKIKSKYFQDCEGRVELAGDKSGKVEMVTLKSTSSNIVIKTDASATIYIDGRKRGVGSWTGRLGAGEYYIDCKKKGHKTLSENIIVKENNDTTFVLDKLEPVYGEVTMISNPSGAQITIDGQTLEKRTPGYVKWLIGSYTALISKEGYDTTSVVIEVKENEIKEYKVTLRKMTQKAQEAVVLPSFEVEGNMVDLGLPSGLKWATCNVGASSPWEFGDYYAWGETEGKDSYSRENCATFAKEIRRIAGNAIYDVASAKLGAGWRIPTQEEFQELVDKCTWSWITYNGVNGYDVCGPNGKSIFIPAAGYFNGETLQGAKEGGNYYTSTPYKNNFDAYYLHINSDEYGVDWNDRSNGLSIRPVFEN